jgi:3-deoxy-manno-octulosonate cytidylyltransferase (CMP-KDO synthetase)
MKILAIIPARYASSRLPGKPLKEIAGKSMIQRVLEQVSKSTVHEVCVATDDERIFDHVRSLEGEVMMTSASHRTGTDRCIEVLKLYLADQKIDIVINVQGDEPFIRPNQLNSLVDAFQDESVQIATLMKKISEKEELFDPNTVKVVGDNRGNALYFSRNPIPFVRGEETENWLEVGDFYKHLGVYAFRSSSMLQIEGLPTGVLEQKESLEQLRWLEAGMKIRLVETNFQSPSIDTEEDLDRVENFLKIHPEFL